VADDISRMARGGFRVDGGDGVKPTGAFRGWDRETRQKRGEKRQG